MKFKFSQIVLFTFILGIVFDIVMVQAQKNFIPMANGLSTCQELQMIKSNLSGNYYLKNDIDCSETEDWNSGKGFEPIGDKNNPFKGSFDGRGHKITNLYINRGSMEYIGLFGNTDFHSEIKNVGLENVRIVGFRQVGGLIGENKGKVSRAYSIKGNVKGEKSIGGLIGCNRGLVNEAFTREGYVYAQHYGGGLVGENRGKIYNTYSVNNSVVGRWELGGLIGFNASGGRGKVFNSYAVGEIKGDHWVGGLIGYNDGVWSPPEEELQARNCFYYSERDALHSWSDGGFPKKIPELKNIATYTDITTEGLNEPWDFVGNPNDDTGNEDIWAIGPRNDGYPYLKFEEILSGDKEKKETLEEEKKPRRNIDKYTPRTVFLISDENWKDILSLVPIAVWTDEDGNINKYPLLIYKTEDEIDVPRVGYDLSSIIYFLQIYNPDKLIIVASSFELDCGNNVDDDKDGFIDFKDRDCNILASLIAEPDSGAGVRPELIQWISPDDYFSFWDSFEKIIYVENNYQLALLSSTYASLINAPLIIEKSSLDSEKIFHGREVICIGQINLRGMAKCNEKYDLKQLQQKYIEKTNTDKVILVNSDDLSFSIEKTYYFSEKGGIIRFILDSQSLASPILASAKHELIVFSNVSRSPEIGRCEVNQDIKNNIEAVDNLVKSQINSLFTKKPEYLTIIASPKAIPDAIPEGCSFLHPNFPSRIGADRKYGEIGSVFIKTGRIYGNTITDLSSYIARDIFYKELFDSLYYNPDTSQYNYAGLSIGNTQYIKGLKGGILGGVKGWFQKAIFGEFFIENAKKIKKKTSEGGYNSVCYVYSNAKPECVGDDNPPDEAYKKKQFITYGGHGDEKSWAGLGRIDIFAFNFPWIDLSYGIGLTCLNNDFWIGEEDTFGVQFLRKGGMGYHGSTGIWYHWGEENKEVQAIKKLTTEEITLGKLDEELFGRGKSNFLLLGDPTLLLKFKKVKW